MKIIWLVLRVFHKNLVQSKKLLEILPGKMLKYMYETRRITV